MMDGLTSWLHPRGASVVGEMIARVAGRWLGHAVNEMEYQWTLLRDDEPRGRRAFRRVSVSAVAWVPLLVCLRVPPSLRAGDAITTWTAGTVVSALVLVVFIYHFGNGLGIVIGLWLWLLSIGLLCGIAAIAFGVIDAVATLGDSTVA